MALAAPGTRDRALEVGTRVRWGVLLACVVANLVGRVLVDRLGIPLFLDMTGTATAAILLGPWWGALVGVATNGLGAIGSGWASLAFVAVNVVGALVWGYGFHRFGMGRTIRRFFALCVLVALACTAVAAPIVVLVFDGTTGHGSDLTIATFQASLDRLATAVLSANLIYSLIDKLLSGFIALALLEAWTEERARKRGQAGEQTTTGISRSVQD